MKADLVPLCEKCSKVVRKLTALCMDEEQVKLKLKINYYLDKLDQLIVLEEKGQANGSLDGKDNPDELKRKIKDKCN